MEASSPLAAIRPSAAPTFGHGDLFRSHAHRSANPFTSGPFGLGDQFSFQRPNPDYFNLKTIRGSSPTVSLAADLSQNFTLTDSSPHFPTPRRALFTTTAVADGIDGRDILATPPPPQSSSPIPTSDVMDVSPLPHKAPFISQVEICSPTPVPSAEEDMVLESPALPRPVFLDPPKPIVPERRKAGLRRPSLSRHKGYSTGLVAHRLHGESQLPAFRFGGDSRVSSGSSLSLSECFEDSPPQDRRPQSANSPCASFAAGIRAKPQFPSLGGVTAFRSGPSLAGHVRRPSNPFNRPRKQCRRSLSMFENPGDVIKPRKDDPPPLPKLQCVMDVDEAREPILPHFFPEGENDSIPRISRSTMIDVLDGKYGEHFDQKMVIDCRFEYEYEGGHIDGAINYNDKELLASHLFRTPMQGRTLLIFHCEYSAHRAPIMARHVRAEDRTVNADAYPRLTYPDIYILDGGYSGFFAEYRDRCYPQAYVEMGDSQHVHTCEREMGRLRQHRKGLSRAQTFAFGQQDRSVEDSPTAPSRPNRLGNRELPQAVIGASPILGNDRCHTRRMASY
ncbi:hypothetical protein VTK73DRAFT_1645 [Phialemonium thermophilum]|uniref:M-phase inducer phosphatase n=1 Tax=Phialemonium thermophilum TaxID=223376 RepID=A0ABR3X8L5_9PEZI